jgi:hypothetical protein
MSDMYTKKVAKGQQASSPTFKKIVSEFKKGNMTITQAINKIVPKGTPKEIKNMLASAIGTQSGDAQAARIIHESRNRYAKKTQTRKPSK